MKLRTGVENGRGIVYVYQAQITSFGENKFFRKIVFGINTDK